MILWQLEKLLDSKQGCLLKVIATNISFFLISGLPSSILSMTKLLAWYFSVKKSGPSNHNFPFLSCCKRLAGSISPLVHISAGFIFPSMFCRSPISVYSSISTTRFATYTLNLWDFSVIYFIQCWICPDFSIKYATAL